MDSYSFGIMSNDIDNISNETDFNLTSPTFRCGVPPVLPPQVPPYIHTIQGVLIVVIAIISTSLNGFLFVLITTRRHLRQSSFCLPLQIVIIHLLMSVIVLPTITVTAFNGRFLLGHNGCQFIGLCIEVTAAARFMMTLAMALDRFLTVFCPYLYTRHVKKMLVIMSMMVWFWAIVIRGMIPLRGILNCYAYVPAFSTCAASNCSKPCQLHIVTTVCINTVCGVFISFVLYVILCCKGKKLTNKASPSITLEPNSRKAQKNRRVHITMLLLFISIVGCSIPALAIYLARSFVQGPNVALVIITTLVGRPFFHALTIADAVVILNNSDVKKEIKKILRKCNDRVHGKQSYNRRSVRSQLHKTDISSTADNLVDQQNQTNP